MLAQVMGSAYRALASANLDSAELVGRPGRAGVAAAMEMRRVEPKAPRVQVCERLCEIFKNLS